MFILYLTRAAVASGEHLTSSPSALFPPTSLELIKLNLNLFGFLLAHYFYLKIAAEPTP